jgi:chemotaxis response regulator CheB
MRQHIAESGAPALSRRLWVVGLGASTGGLTALTEILSVLPRDFSAGVVVVLHTSPFHKSYLAETSPAAPPCG